MSKTSQARARLSPRLKGTALLVAVACVVLGAGCRGEKTSAHLGPPNVLMIVIDSLRLDRVGAFGSRKGLTPFLDRLASESIVYDRAYVQTSWTVPSVASMFLGSYPSEHRVTGFSKAIPDDAHTLAEILGEHGFTTAAFTANATIHVLSGFPQGFEQYELVGEPTIWNPKSDGSLMNAGILAWREKAEPRKPFFGYFHFMDVHSPYRQHDGITASPPPDVGLSDHDLNLKVMTGAWQKTEELRKLKWTFTPSQLQRIEQLYDGEVRYQDDFLAALFAALERRGDLEHTLVVVTADHGEEFGEHGAYGHGSTLYQTAIHVPLIIRLPDRRRPVRVSVPVELGGVGSTILDLVGIERPSTFVIDPVPLSDPASPAERYAYSELVESQMKVRFHERAIMNADSKLLVDPAGSLVSYDLRKDPREQQPLATPDSELELALTSVRSRLRAHGVAEKEIAIDEATRERLHGLGYLPKDDEEEKAR